MRNVVPRDRYNKTEHFKIKKALSHVKTGTHTSGTYSKYLVTLFGCGGCSWKGTEFCPHAKKGTEAHTNDICSERILFAKDLFRLAGDITRFYQMDELIKNKLLSDKMLADYGRTGDLHKDFVKVSKNIITDADKMRRQDEGIKIQQDTVDKQDKIWAVIETGYEKIKKKNDENSDNGEGDTEPE